jgi:WhiB family redox-sensing transcriptional regulator
MTQSSTAWRDSAACRGVEKDFYPASGKNNLRVRAIVKEALAMCNGCPVRLDCLNWAVENKEFYGIWGGTTERERRLMIENHAPFADTTIRMPIVEIGSIMLPREKESE